MKRILFLLLAVSATSATFAQRATKASPAKPAAQPTEAPAVDPKLQFASKINELDANLSRKRTDAAKTIFAELQTLMETNVRTVTNKPYLNNRYQIYNEVRTMAGQDLAANRDVVVAKLREFLGYM